MSDSGSGLYVIFVLAFIVILIAAQWKIFEKAGVEGWKALIPFYNSYCLCEIVFGNGIFFLGLMIPYVNIAFGIFLAYKLGKAYGKETGFILGLIFLPFIFLLILGFDDSEYLGPQELSL